MCVFTPKQEREPELSGLMMVSTVCACSAWSYFGEKWKKVTSFIKSQEQHSTKNLTARREEATNVLTAEH